MKHMLISSLGVIMIGFGWGESFRLALWLLNQPTDGALLAAVVLLLVSTFAAAALMVELMKRSLR